MKKPEDKKHNWKEEEEKNKNMTQTLREKGGKGEDGSLPQPELAIEQENGSFRCALMIFVVGWPLDGNPS